MNDIKVKAQQKIRVKITTPIRLNVDIDETGVTVATISTEQISTCHFLLLVGYFEHVRFALLHHTTAYFPSSSISSSEPNKTTTKSEPEVYTRFRQEFCRETPRIRLWNRFRPSKPTVSVPDCLIWPILLNYQDENVTLGPTS
ncbi:unnamed protein product [Adineta steineri]|uniref:Uncharacterized protein n=1 Tax=Adineta steineri TaxID=433720 RepID=A0A814KQ75_9BILA|nr:unnamed protein product [Adineta steineri]CAF1205517.1 unnamed protein product [Adineta steineri]CAF3950683.1 unnamed protein product [Adineta steineri]CAF4028725.1 unnamed protein product [Adineta steineri]